MISMNPLNKAWFVLKELSSKDLEMASLTGDVPRLGAGGPGASTRVGPEWWEKWGHLHPHQDRSQENFDAPGDAHFHGDGLGDDSEEAHAANMSPLTLDEGFLPDHTMSDPNEIGEDSYRSTPSVQESYYKEPEQVSREKSYWDTRGSQHTYPEHLWTRDGVSAEGRPENQHWGKKDDAPSDPEFKPYMDLPERVPEKVTQGPWRHENAQGFDDIAGNEEQMRPPTPKTPSLDYTSYMAAQPQPGPLPSSERQALMEHYGMPQSPPPPPPPPQRDAMAMLREKQMANIERLKAQRLGRMPGRRRR